MMLYGPTFQSQVVGTLGRLQACLNGKQDELEAAAALEASWSKFLPFITPVRTETNVPTKYAASAFPVSLR
jgi:hypothetical protein